MMEYYQSLQRVPFKSLNAKYSQLNLVDLKERQRSVPVFESLDFYRTERTLTRQARGLGRAETKRQGLATKVTTLLSPATTPPAD